MRFIAVLHSLLALELLASSAICQGFGQQQLLTSEAIAPVSIYATDMDACPSAPERAKVMSVPPPVERLGDVSKLISPDAQAHEHFGEALAVGERYAVVGNPLDDERGEEAGAVYIYARPVDTGGILERHPASWPMIAKLTASDGFKGDHFGQAVATSGSWILVGAPRDGCGASNGHPTECGSAYIFEEDGAGGWIERKLRSSDASPWQWFGIALALDGSTAIIGAYGDDSRGLDAGAAYVFEHDGNGGWRESCKLTAADGEAQDWLAWKVALGGEVAVLGAYNSGGAFGLVGSGSGYVFRRDTAGRWHEEAELTAGDGEEWDHLGRSVAVERGMAVLGSHRNDQSRGAAYVFCDLGGTWSQVQKLVTSNAQPGAALGASVAITDQCIIAGAPGQDLHSPRSGAVYIFELGSTGWVETLELGPPTSAKDDLFGLPLATSQGSLFCGAYLDDTAALDAGAVYVFQVQ